MHDIGPPVCPVAQAGYALGSAGDQPAQAGAGTSGLPLCIPM